MFEDLPANALTSGSTSLGFEFWGKSAGKLKAGIDVNSAADAATLGPGEAPACLQPPLRQLRALITRKIPLYNG